MKRHDKTRLIALLCLGEAAGPILLECAVDTTAHGRNANEHVLRHHACQC
jgi:hypothetical protein